METLVDRVLALESLALWAGVILWAVLSLAAAGIAAGKGRSAGVYLLLSLVTSPLAGMLVVTLLPDRRAAEIAELEARLGIETPPAPGEGRFRVGAALLVAALILVAVIAGVSTIGSSANDTFTTISEDI